MQKTLTFAIAVVLALTSAGCIQNMSDLRDRVGGSDEENLTSAAIEGPDATESTNTTLSTNTSVKRPPVARISIFGDAGVLVYKSNFQAEDSTDLIPVDQEATLTLIAADSEAVERGATLSTYAWTFSGKAIEGGRQATLVAEPAGLHTLTLTVTDSNGKTDQQTLQLAIAPKPFEQVTSLTTGPVAGALGLGEVGTLTFDLANATDVVAMITKVTFVATPPQACDIILTVTGPEEEVGSVDSASDGEAETLSAGMLPVGTYTIEVAPYSCAAPEGIPVVVTVVYTPVVEGIDPHGGHGDHGGH